MTSIERVQATLDLRKPDRVPVDLHNFQPAAAMLGVSLPEIFKSGELLAEAMIKAWRAFGHDLILLDNRRSHIYASGDQYAEALACIRCGSCLNICPVYRRVGGHAYGWVYSGPIGAVISPLMVGLENAAPLPHASSLCGACKDACPVDIDLPRMLLNLRRDLVDEGHADPTITLGIKGWAVAMQSPKLYELGGKAASGATQIAANGDESLHNLPGPLGNWTRNRDFPPFAKKSFRQLWRDHQKEQKGL